MSRPISTTKLVILALLGLSAVILGTAVLSLQLQVLTVQQEIQIQKAASSSSKSSSSSAHSSSDIPLNTIQSSEPTTIHLSQRLTPPDPTSYKLVGEAYWNQVLLATQDWNIGTDTSSSLSSRLQQQSFLLSSSSSNSNATRLDPIFALQQAAKAGHPEAQYYLANALASGIWPFDNAVDNDKQPSQTKKKLHVTDEWISAHPRRQLQESYLNWHMAAMGGNIEAAMAMAVRKGEAATSSSSSGSGSNTHHHNSANSNSLQVCQETLPYLEAAAHGIMDLLEQDPNSRAKVVPPMDRHLLTEIHMHGGTSSQLSWENKPDESEEALQFYHLKATTSWKNPSSSSAASSSKKSKNAKDSKKKTTEKESPTIDVHAAYTLGHLYHFGVRGVQQNLTLSLQYYEIAAVNGHWESAGQAGMMYFWGMGCDKDIEIAHDYFKIGAPYGLEGCRRKHDHALKQQKQKDSDLEYVSVSECDETAVNGLGLVHLFGIEGVLEVDLAEAERYFVLAKEMGNSDAHYNLAMIWMGWKTHFKNVEDLSEDGVSVLSENPFADITKGQHDNKDGGKEGTKGSGGKPALDYALHQSRTTGRTFKGPLQSDLGDAIKLLTVAAARGHLQSKHRLAMIYSQGVRIQTAALTFDAIKPDCIKAKNYYQHIVEHAAPSNSKRLRKAYKDYINGDLESSLRNYLLVAETGVRVGQVNAAFLLERGTCLGLSQADCAKASVRLWKAAANKGGMEAILRVGDFYYYGRLRDEALPKGPFAWVQYVLYPEDYLPLLLEEWWNKLQKYFLGTNVEEAPTCSSEEGDCSMGDAIDDDESYADHEKELIKADMALAAHYYTMAVDKYQSPRGNFNLGFMHEWGLGVTQDFPLAKRHYDLAHGDVTGEAELSAQIALWFMNAHEMYVKWHVAWMDWREGKATTTKSQQKGTSSSSTPASKAGKVPVPKVRPAKVGAPTPGKVRTTDKTEMDIILSHLFSWSSLLICVLTYILVVLNQMRARRGGV